MRVQVLALVLLVAIVCGCQRMPRGNWIVETGRARVVMDEAGTRQPRISAVTWAQRDARMKLLRDVEGTLAGDSNLIGDHMVQNPLIGTRVRAVILGARQFAERYRDDGTVEVDMGVNLDVVRQVVRETKP